MKDYYFWETFFAVGMLMVMPGLLENNRKDGRFLHRTTMRCRLFSRKIVMWDVNSQEQVKKIKIKKWVHSLCCAYVNALENCVTRLWDRNQALWEEAWLCESVVVSQHIISESCVIGSAAQVRSALLSLSQKPWIVTTNHQTETSEAVTLTALPL